LKRIIYTFVLDKEAHFEEKYLFDFIDWLALHGIVLPA
jgi:hypothetical protein